VEDRDAQPARAADDVNTRLLLLGLALAVTGCGSSATEATNYTVTVRNASTVTLTEVRVATGPDDEIAASTLSPGQSTEGQRTREMHENPSVSVKANGRVLSAHPIEGFIEGFNHSLTKGAYAITLNLVGTAAEPSLSVTVQAVTTVQP
jgi:hypothetical protein